MNATIIWDLEDEPDGNVQHLLEHDVTIDEAEEVLLDAQTSRAVIRAADCVRLDLYELVDEDPLTLRPVTAYDVPPPAGKKRRKR